MHQFNSSRDDPIHTPEMGVNDAYYSYLASTQQRRHVLEKPLLAITDAKHRPETDDDEELDGRRPKQRYNHNDDNFEKQLKKWQ